MKCKYFEGEENIAPETAAEARKLIGMKVKYLCSRDIDRSGRGYFFPRHGVVAAVVGREIAIDEPSNFCIDLGSLVEMVRA